MPAIKRYPLMALTLLLAVLPAAAQALEYRSVAAPAVLYDSPALAGKKLYVVSAGFPVEVVVDLSGWTKVRDSKGALAWIQAKSLSTQRTVVVTAQVGMIRQSPDSNASVVLRVAQDVVLDRLDGAPAGWVKVHHRDGVNGYISVSDVWGE